HVGTTPLTLEAMCAAAGCASAKVEHPGAPPDRALHERPVQEHVGGDVARFPERSGPGHLELLTPEKTTPGGDGLGSAIDDAELDEFGKQGRHALEERSRQHWRAEIPHRAREHFVEWLTLLGTEARGQAFFHRAPNLTAELGGK